jgi:hypothetical protein
LKDFWRRKAMYGFEVYVRPILEEAGVFKGAEVSVKEVFEKYLEKYPQGIGPLWKFKAFVSHEFGLGTREVWSGDRVDILFTYNPIQDFLHYDPRHSANCNRCHPDL